MSSVLVGPSLVNLDIEVKQIDEVRTLYDRIKVYRSTTGIDGAYSEVTDASTRITLEAGQIRYNYLDATGAETYYYTIAYFNTTTSAESAQTDPFLGKRDAALDILSVEDVKNTYLFGLDLTADDGTPIPDSTFEFYIKYAVTYLATYLDVKIGKEVITGELHDFYWPDYQTYIWLQLHHVPVISIDQVKLTLPNQNDVITYDAGWIYDRKAAGQLQIIPGSGEISIVTLGLSGAWLPFAYGRTKHLPNVFNVNYTAGFEKGCVPADILHALGMIAALGPFNILGDILIGAGIASESISLDGLSQSVGTTSSATNSGFGARIGQYEKSLKTMLPRLRAAYHPISLTVV